MHISHLFTRYPHARYSNYKTFRHVSPDARASFEVSCVLIAIVGMAFVSAIGANGALSFANPLVQWGWVVPSLIMTPFIIWRIVTRSCARHDGLTFGNFLFRNVYLPSHGFTFLHVLMYVALAYCPLLNWACILAGAVSIILCEFSLNCPRIFMRKT